jgi:hypothetical protein
MSGALIGITGLIYTYVFVDQFMKGNTGMGLAYLGYAFSNIGLFMSVTK